VRKTGRCLVVHEDVITCGFGAEVAAWVGEHCFESLDAPVRRVAAIDTHVAYEPSLAAAVLPQVDDIATAIKTLGDWLGTADAAKPAARQVRDRLRDLRARYANASVLRVFYEIQVRPLYTINADSPISEAIALCGGVNLFADLGALATTVSLEAVFAANPDVVIYARQDEASTREFWREHRQLPAVAAGRLYPVNADLLARATPRMLDGIEELCGALQRARGN